LTDDTLLYAHDRLCKEVNGYDRFTWVGIIRFVKLFHLQIKMVEQYALAQILTAFQGCFIFY